MTTTLYPLGDPDEIRAYARQLREQAAAVGEIARSAHSATDAMEFRAPVATRFRGRVGGNAGNQSRLSTELQQLAGLLEHAAAAAAEAHTGAVLDQVARDRAAASAAGTGQHEAAR